MGINIYRRHAYDDVTLLASTDLEASQWTLEVEGHQNSTWQPVMAVVMDSHLNWSTTDLSLWEGLCHGDATSIKQAFPEASSVVPAGVPFAVMWNVSEWVYEWLNQGFRFIDPPGSIYEFQHDWRQPELSFG
jgi:hypothetical protein